MPSDDTSNATGAPAADASDEHPSLLGHNRLLSELHQLLGELRQLDGQGDEALATYVDIVIDTGRREGRALEIVTRLYGPEERKRWVKVNRPYRHYNTCLNHIRIAKAVDEGVLPRKTVVRLGVKAALKAIAEADEEKRSRLANADPDKGRKASPRPKISKPISEVREPKFGQVLRIEYEPTDGAEKVAVIWSKDPADEGQKPLYQWALLHYQKDKHENTKWHHRCTMDDEQSFPASWDQLSKVILPRFGIGMLGIKRIGTLPYEPVALILMEDLRRFLEGNLEDKWDPEAQAASSKRIREEQQREREHREQERRDLWGLLLLFGKFDNSAE
jgi:hypothetical protein